MLLKQEVKHRHFFGFKGLRRIIAFFNIFFWWWLWVSQWIQTEIIRKNGSAQAVQTWYCLLHLEFHASKLGHVKTNFTWCPTNSRSVMFDNDYASPCWAEMREGGAGRDWNRYKQHILPLHGVKRSIMEKSWFMSMVGGMSQGLLFLSSNTNKIFHRYGRLDSDWISVCSKWKETRRGEF